MNLYNEIIIYPKHYKKIPHPFYVVACGDHFMVCELDDNFNLIEERSNITWDRYQCRRWALEIGLQAIKRNQRSDESTQRPNQG